MALCFKDGIKQSFDHRTYVSGKPVTCSTWLILVYEIRCFSGAVSLFPKAVISRYFTELQMYTNSEEANTLFRRFATRYFTRFGPKGAEDSHNLQRKWLLPLPLIPWYLVTIEAICLPNFTERYLRNNFKSTGEKTFTLKSSRTKSEKNLTKWYEHPTYSTLNKVNRPP